MRILKTFISFIFIIIAIYIFWIWMQHQKDIITPHYSTAVVEKLQSIQKLETTQMTITQIIEGEDQLTDLIPGVGLDNMINEFLFQDKIVLEVEGKVTAGFDLSKINTGDIQVDKDSMQIQLPPAEILNIELLTGTKPFDRKLGLLTKGNLQMETTIRNKAKDMLKQNAIQAGILDTAMQNASDALSKILGPIGVKNIIVK